MKYWTLTEVLGVKYMLCTSDSNLEPNEVPRNYGKLFYTVLAAIFLGGCTASEGQKGWGDDVKWPDGDRLAKAARKALLDPQTYIPAAGALVFTIDNWDHKVSHWATERTPVFGSQKGAEDASDYLLYPIIGETVITALATPSGDSNEQWSAGKAKGLGVEGAAFGVTALSTSVLKDTTGRERPDRSNNQSFPSGHASGAFAGATLSNRNLDSIDMSDGLRTTLQVGNITMASGVAWARVEGNKHFPSDVLAGAALGHFLTAFIHDAFMNLPEDGSVDMEVVPFDHGVAVCFSIRY
ncbi:MAG: phosphatase PAP2 family protein [Sedimentisphaerales bacterium]